MTKLDMAKVGRSGRHTKEELGALQVAVSVMCGGGPLGEFAATQPADFYIDSRCGRLPYNKREVMQAVSCLATLAKAAGMDPCHLPKPQSFHACGIW